MWRIPVIFRNNGLVGLNVPSGFSSQSPGKTEIDLVSFMKARNNGFGGLVHRIDKRTSGLHLVAENQAVLGSLMKGWKTLTKKYYLAVVPTPTWEEVVIAKEVVQRRQGQQPRMLMAETGFLALQTVGDWTLVQCELRGTGRYHQIRQHAQQLGLPLLGDTLYGGQRSSLRAGQFLHAWRMIVRHPLTNEKFRLQASLPEDFRQLPGFVWEFWDHGASKTQEVWNAPDRKADL